MRPRGAERVDPFVVITALAVAANLAIVWGFDHVAAQDHANHVASLRVLRGLWERDPFFTARFTVAPSPVPDLLSEALWFVALRPLGEAVASKALLSLYVAGLPAAWWAFVRRYCAAETALLPLAPLVTMNIYYSLGSTNFLLGLPLFLAGSVAWDAARSGRSLAPLALAAALTWLAHVYDYVFLMIFAAAHVASGWRSGRGPARRELMAGAGLAAGFACAAAAVLSRESGEWAASAPPTFDLSLRELAHFVDEALFLRGDGGTRYAAAALALLPAAAIAAALQRGSLRSALRPAVALAAALTLAAAWVAPMSVGAEGSIKERFGVPALLFVMASVAAPPSRWHRALAAAVLCSVFALKWRDELRVHGRFDRRARALDVALASKVPRHARVLPVFWWRRRTVEDTLFVHYADRLVVTRDAYVPDLFAAPGQQILRYRAPHAPPPDRPEALDARSVEGFDLVWAQTDAPDALLARVRDRLEPVASSGRHALYRVRDRGSTHERMHNSASSASPSNDLRR